MNKRIVTVGLAIICSLPALSQEGRYELLFLQKEYDTILQESAVLNNETDYLWNAIALRQTGELAGSMEVAELGVAIYPEHKPLEMLLGELYFSAGRYSMAKPLLNRYREHRDYFMMLIRVLEFESDHNRAIILLSERLPEPPLDREYLGRLADNCIKADSLVRAKKIYETLVSLDSADQRSLTRLANVHLELREYNESVMVCNRALEMDSTNLTLHRIKGFASFRNGSFGTARESFRVLHESGDSGKVILKHLGISEIKDHEYDDARKHLLQLYALDSTDHEVCFFLGRAFLNSDEPGRGLFFLERADSLARPDPEVLAAIYVEMIAIYTSLKKHADAIEAYEKAYAYSPKPEYLFFMASSYEFNLENKKKALETYERFVASLPPKDANAADPSQDEASGNLSQEREPAKQTGQPDRLISMKEVALRNIERLREELFFEGALD